MRILISNDDGIRAEGLNILASRLGSEVGNDVYVVAPDRERSATGHAITMHKPLRTQEFHIPKVKEAWATNGTPSDCVKFALGVIMNPLPDIVISGINDKSNLGTDLLYSGTVSAAMEGTIANIPSIAVSLICSTEKNFSTAAEFVAQFIKYLPESEIPKDNLLNVNIPDLKWSEIKGVAVTEMSIRSYTNDWEKRVDPRGNIYYWHSGKLIELPSSETTDMSAILQGKISVTPICTKMTDHATVKSMQKWSVLNSLFSSPTYHR